jgi:hypothetical protein
MNNKKITLEFCDLAEKHHCQRHRQFAHVFHRAGVICISRAFFDLPQAYQAGILLHEFGHLSYAGHEEHTEEEADMMGFILSGIQIHRRTYHGLKALEWVRPADKGRALDFLRKHLTNGAHEN